MEERRRLCGTPFCGSEWLGFMVNDYAKRLFFDGVISRQGSRWKKKNSILNGSDSFLSKQSWNSIIVVGNEDAAYGICGTHMQ